MIERYDASLKEISALLAADSRVERIVAFGSRVRGDFRGDSDMDVLVIVTRKDRELKDSILSLFYTYELERDLSFSLAVFSRDEYEFNRRLGSPFIKNVEQEGLTYYDAERGREEGAVKVSAR
jgi:predicted nucleotidyltransferase